MRVSLIELETELHSWREPSQKLLPHIKASGIEADASITRIFDVRLGEANATKLNEHRRMNFMCYFPQMFSPDSKDFPNNYGCTIQGEKNRFSVSNGHWNWRM